MTKCGMAEMVKDLVGGRLRTENLRRKFAKVASEQWGGEELKEMLGEQLMPSQPSKGFLETINALARAVDELEDAKELLAAARHGRLGVRGASNDWKLRIEDVKAAMRQAVAWGPKRSQIMEAEAEPEPGSKSVRAGVKVGVRLRVRGRDGRAGMGPWMPKRGTAVVAEHAMDILKVKDLSRRLKSWEQSRMRHCRECAIDISGGL